MSEMVAVELGSKGQAIELEGDILFHIFFDLLMLQQQQIDLIFPQFGYALHG
jgi:hypothetical protein